MNIQSNKVFVSAFRSIQSEHLNRLNHAEARNVLIRGGFNFKVVEGVYKGVKELSFVLFADNVDTHTMNMTEALNIARRFGQESILEVHNDGAAELHYLDNGYRVERIGRFRGASEQDAVNRDAYTRDPVSGAYFVVE